jgi:hypothetical protein
MGSDPNYRTNSAAAILRRSPTSTLNVRQAAAVSIISKPMPWRSMSVMTVAGGKICSIPVPEIISSGRDRIAAEKSAMLSSEMFAGDQFSIISSADTMT